MAIISKTAAQWDAAKMTVLAAGDVAYETDTYLRKIGDGVNTWEVLDYEFIFIPRQDTKVHWLTIDPVIGDGEFVVETDSKRHKFGDGIKKYSELPYGDEFVDKKIGDLNQLQTASKDSLVKAVNETNVKIDNLEQKSLRPMQGLIIPIGSRINTIWNEKDLFKDSFSLVMFCEGNAIIVNSNYGNRFEYGIDGNAYATFGVIPNRSQKGGMPQLNTVIGTYDKTTNEIICYCNGEKFTTRLYTEGSFPTANIFFGTNSKLGIVYSIRRLNYAFTQADVDRFYNQGRVFDVQLGDEFRLSDFVNSNTIFTIRPNGTDPLATPTYNIIPSNGFDKPYTRISYTGKSIISNWFTKEATIGINPFPRGLVIKLCFKYRCNFDSYVGTAKEILRNEGQALYKELMAQSSGTGTWALLDGDSTYYSLFNNIETGSWIEFQLVSIIPARIIDEFTPDSLTSKRWVNTGTSTTNIEFTNPVFSYQNPIKERQWTTQGSTYPTPVAMGQKLYILNNDGTRTIRESPCKPNDRQWDNQKDWQ